MLLFEYVEHKTKRGVNSSASENIVNRTDQMRTFYYKVYETFELWLRLTIENFTAYGYVHTLCIFALVLEQTCRKLYSLNVT